MSSGFTKFQVTEPSGSFKEDFYRGSNLGLSQAGLFWTLEPQFEQTLVNHHKEMLHTKFQASELSGFGKEDF